ncbi:MAG: S41 family peptidase [Planctomycetia bacterium]|nr:MAG: S41 family peptidase [Planctomycetia bacterium]
MRLLRLTPLMALLLLLGLPSAPAIGEGLGDAYARILNGDYSGGRDAAVSAAKVSAEEPAAKRVLGWLDSYSAMSEERARLREETLAWSSEQAQKALAEDRLFLALTFTARAAQYATTKAEFAGQEWVQGIINQSRLEAARLEAVPRWRDALSYYFRLEQILERNPELKAAREHAARHARLEAVYTDQKAVERRIKGVRREMLYEALRKIDAYYFEAPKHRVLALAALDNLDAMLETPKLQQVFDGLANEDSRRSFTDGLRELRAGIEQREALPRKDFQRLFDEVAELNRRTVGLPDELIVVEFTEGAVSRLDDFSSMIWPADSNEFDKMLTGDFCGVGISLGVDEISNRLKVVSPLENSPALEAGILPNDLIIEVNSESTKNWSTEDAVRHITGKPQTSVTLVIFRPSTGQRLEFPLTRREIHLRSIEGHARMADDPSRWNYIVDPVEGIAYIRLTNFSPRSSDELGAALHAAREQGMKGLVLDLRYNPGGLLEAAVDIVAKFMPSGEVVITRGRQERPERYEVSGKAPFAGVPLIVLVNEASASASEILAGAFRDHGRAVVLGERTFGKGSVQKVIPLENNLFGRGADPGARIKLTTSLYYLPNGGTPHRSPDAEDWGVNPDWQIGLTPKEAVQVIESRRDAAVLRKEATPAPELSEDDRLRNLEALKTERDADEDEPLLSVADIALIESDPFKAARVDPQLEYALLHLRAKLAANVPWPKIAARAAAQSAKLP